MFWLRMAAATIFFTALLPYCPTALLPYCPTALLPYCPTALLPYCPTQVTTDGSVRPLRFFTSAICSAASISGASVACVSRLCFAGSAS